MLLLFTWVGPRTGDSGSTVGGTGEEDRAWPVEVIAGLELPTPVFAPVDMNVPRD